MKLNLDKCTFGKPLGKLLGYMVSRRRIDPNAEKVSVITWMAPPESLHDIQKLTWCMAALSRFMSWLGVRGSLSSSSSKGKISSNGPERLMKLSKITWSTWLPHQPWWPQNPMKPCSCIYLLQATWLLRQSSSSEGSRVPTARSSTQSTLSAKSWVTQRLGISTSWS
jgi:hypothetical protein